MALNGRVRFIRKGGRVIPIRVEATERGKKDAKLAAQGAGLTAAGVGVGVASGAAYRKSVRFTTGISARAFKSLERVNSLKRPSTLFGHATRTARVATVHKLTSQAFRSSKAIGRLTPGFRIGGQAVASGLIGVGVAKLYRARRKEANTAETASVAGVAGTAAFLGGSHGYQGVKSVLRDTAMAAHPLLNHPVVRRIKTKFHL